MLLWFVGLALVVAWLVFRDPAIDYRVLMVGAVLPDVVDAPFGGARVAHTLLFSVVLLTVVMVATRGHRHARRRWLFVPVGTFVHLVADGIVGRAETFWWPFLGSGGLDGRLPSLDHGAAVVLVQELAGLAAIVWFATTTGLVGDPAAPAARRAFLRTGRLPRHRVG